MLNQWPNPDMILLNFVNKTVTFFKLTILFTKICDPAQKD